MTDSHIGKTIYVSAALPATNDSSGFQALSWTPVVGVQQLPQLGVSHSNIDVPDLQTGFTSGLKGPASGQDTQMQFRTVDSDAGAAIVLAQAEDKDGEISIKIGKGSGTDQALQAGDPVEYAQGYVHSYLPIQGSDTTHEGFTAMFKQNDFTVVATESA